MSKKRILILISGRGSNMKAIAENVDHGILQNLCEIVTVFSNKSDAPGIALACEKGIPVQVISSRGKTKTEYNRKLLDFLRSMQPDLIVLAGYMRILPVEIVRAFPDRIINIHPADTRKHRGLHGYAWAWEKGLNTTKITVHFVDEGLDSGRIIAQKDVDLTGAQDIIEVEKRGLAVEHVFYSECLRNLLLSIRS
ncbi:MAG: phosphoribosylglycinamide formyltransferase [Candidatus Cloacimonetes bacterium]|nr:phosphoribosylglycinamide formyltransferase [Candidatus Cloacimonadota bacterium]